jgi:hypothetical protein
MSWRSEWAALSGRIEGLLDAARFYAQGLGISREDPFNLPDKVFKPQIKGLFDELRRFGAAYSGQLPTAAKGAIDSFFGRHSEYFAAEVKGHGAVIATMTSLAALRAELAYHFGDRMEHARRLSERAFVHLQRSIVVDRMVRDRWARAFEEGETACEKLGSVHLLQHGIWAFKASAVGERTDLVLGERLTDFGDVDRVAEALVLTEWKRAEIESERDRRLEEAWRQASRYSEGILAGIEMAQYRYLVLVSRDWIRMPGDRVDGDVVYRHVNVAVDPRTPAGRPQQMN